MDSVETTTPNNSVETNRRPALPFAVGRQFWSASWAPPFLSAAVAHLCRYALNSHRTSVSVTPGTSIIAGQTAGWSRQIRLTEAVWSYL